MSIQPLFHPDAPSDSAPGPVGGLSDPADPPKGGGPGSASPVAFEDVYEKWFDEVAKWIRALGGPEADRDDLVQEVFIVVHRRLHDFDGQNLAGWLYRITRRKVRDHRRLSWAKRLFLSDPTTLAASEQASTNPQVSLEIRERRELLMTLLGGLNDSERAAIVLFEIEGYSGQQIAEVQGIPLNTVWTRIHKARKKLGHRLETLENARQKRRPE